MNVDEVRKNAEKVIERADRLISLSNDPRFKEYVEILDTLLRQEMAALAGVELSNSYYKHVGFIQATAFIRALPSVVKDPKTRDFLLGQGRAKALETLKNIPQMFAKQKAAAQQQLFQLFGNSKESAEEARRATAEDAYKNS